MSIKNKVALISSSVLLLGVFAIVGVSASDSEAGSDIFHCGDFYGATCEEIDDGFKAVLPNFRKNGVPDTDQVEGIPDAYLLISANYSVLGADGDTPIQGLSPESAELADLVPSDGDYPWRVGIIGEKGNPSEGSYTVYIDNLDDEVAYRSHFYLGLSEDEIAFVESADYLHFARPANGATVRDLLKAKEYIRDSINDHPEVFESGAMFSTNAESGKITITIGALEDHDAAVDLLGNIDGYTEILVDSEFDPQLYSGVSSSSSSAGAVPSGGRGIDYSPHGGGAGVKWVTSGVIVDLCTTGAALVGRTNGTRYGSIAGHCGPNGTTFTSYTAGGEHGNVAGRNDFPSYDAARLSGSTYNYWLWTNGLDNINRRAVVGSGGIVTGNTYCVSGAVTLANCTGTVTSQNVCIYLVGTWGAGTICHLAVMTNSTSQGALAQEGDSGGPVYTRNVDNDRANYKGWVTGGNGSHTMYMSMFVPNSDYLNSNIYYRP